MLEANSFKEFTDGKTIEGEDGLKTCCDICGEWLQYSAKIVYDSSANMQSIIIESTSCGEVFILIPTQYRMEKVKKSELY